MRINTTLSAFAWLAGAAAMFCACGAVANPPATNPPVARPSGPTAPRAPSSSNTATPTPPSLRGCNKQADARNLTGKDRATFIKDCEAGKADSDD